MDDFYTEPRRARRIRDRERLIARHRRRAAERWYEGPEDHRRNRETGELVIAGCWYDAQGRHDGPHDWAEVFAARDYRASVTWDNATPCSCYMCGNPRTWMKANTGPEVRADQDAREQFADVGLRFRSRFRDQG